MEQYIDLDAIDIQIVNSIQENSKLTNAEIARRVELSAPAVHGRIKRLEENGIICGYTALIDREALGFDMLCFIQVSVNSHNPDYVLTFRERLADMPEVLECYQLIGDIDYLMKVVLRNKSDLQRFLMERLTPIEGIARIKTSLALTEIKSSTVLPISASMPEVANNP